MGDDFDDMLKRFNTKFDLTDTLGSLSKTADDLKKSDDCGDCPDEFL